MSYMLGLWKMQRSDKDMMLLSIDASEIDPGALKHNEVTDNSLVDVANKRHITFKAIGSIVREEL